MSESEETYSDKILNELREMSVASKDMIENMTDLRQLYSAQAVTMLAMVVNKFADLDQHLSSQGDIPKDWYQP